MNPLFFIIGVICIFLFIIGFSVFKTYKIKRLTKTGQKLNARFVKQKQSNSLRNGVHGSYIFVQGDGGVMYKSNKTFHSFSPTYLENNIFNVYVDMADPENYYVEIDFEPIRQKIMIPFVSEAKLRKQGNIITAKGMYISSHIILNKDCRDARYYVLFVREDSGQQRIFKSKKIYRKPPMGWFQNHLFTVYVNPLDERRYFVDDQVPSIGETVLKGIGEMGEVINSYRNNSL